MNTQSIDTVCDSALVDSAPFFESPDGYQLYSTTDKNLFCVKGIHARPYNKYATAMTNDKIIEGFKKNAEAFEVHASTPLKTTRDHSFSGKKINILKFSFTEDWSFNTTEQHMEIYSKNVNNRGFIRLHSRLDDTGKEHTSVMMLLDENIKSKVMTRIIAIGLFKIFGEIIQN